MTTFTCCNSAAFCSRVPFLNETSPDDLWQQCDTLHSRENKTRCHTVDTAVAATQSKLWKLILLLQLLPSPLSPPGSLCVCSSQSVFLSLPLSLPPQPPRPHTPSLEYKAEARREASAFLSAVYSGSVFPFSHLSPVPLLVHPVQPPSSEGYHLIKSCVSFDTQVLTQVLLQLGSERKKKETEDKEKYNGCVNFRKRDFQQFLCWWALSLSF